MPNPHTHRSSESGGITILLALILLSVMTVAAFGLSRNTLREVAITGNESIGRKAFESADSGLDWTITWGNPYAAPAAGTARESLQLALKNILDAIDNVDKRVAGADSTASTVGSGNMSSTSGTFRVYLDGRALGGDMKPLLTNLSQVSEIQPSFDLEVRYLGPYTLADTGTSNLIKNKRSLWLVRTTGRADVGTTLQSFISRREALMEYIN